MVVKYRIDSIADLALQLRFAPSATQGNQLAAAEDLLHELVPAKAYPLDFVVYRITGYHPRTVPEGLLTGIALQHDLGLLIEHLSEGLNTQVRDVAEPVLDIDDVCERFNVTSKTIQRWRRRGLPARRFVFADQKRRVGFLLSSVERFFSGHREQVARGMNFSQISDEERADIIRRARRLGGQCRCCVNEIARRIARRLNRSPLTVLHTIRKHDQEHPGEEILLPAEAGIGEADRIAIVKAHRRGVSLRTLSRRYCSTRSAIYRVVLEERLAKLGRRKLKFVDDPLYHQEDAEGAVNTIASQQELASDGEPEERRVPQGLPPYLQELYRTPLLTPSRERALFLKFNFYKYRFVQARRRLEPQFARSRDLDELEELLCRATEVKNQIVRANLRLVVSIARKHLRPGLGLMELISEGNVILMRAVESFDAHKGYRLSTYATLALMKGYARLVPAMQSGGMPANRTSLVGDLADTRTESAQRSLVERDEVRQLLTRLDERERSIVRDHFGLDEGEPATYEQLARRWGLSKQRVRQIERGALQKLRGDSTGVI
jgi:RNA polymerase sigma factor (sigma-70 family)